MTETKNLIPLEAYKIEPPIIEGYMLVSEPANSTGIAGEVNEDVEFIYGEESILEIIYIDQLTNLQIANEKLAVARDSVKNVNLKKIPGYTISDYKTTNIPILKPYTKVEFKYIQNDKEWNVVRKFIDNNGNDIIKPIVEKLTYGQEYNFLDKEIEGYTQVSKNEKTQGTFYGDFAEITHHYEENIEQISENTTESTIKVIHNYMSFDPITSKIQSTIEEEEIKGILFSKIFIKPRYKEGYTTYSYSGEMVKFEHEPRAIEIEYAPLITEVKIIHKDIKTNKELEVEIKKGYLNKQFIINKKDFPEYELLEKPDNLKGVFSKENQILEIMYKKIEIAVVDEKTREVMEIYSDIKKNEFEQAVKNIISKYTFENLENYEVVSKPNLGVTNDTFNLGYKYLIVLKKEVVSSSNDFLVTINLESNNAQKQESIKVVKGIELRLPEPSKDNYTFLGWFTKDGFFQNAYMIAENDLDLHAEWLEDNKKTSILNIFEKNKLVDQLFLDMNETMNFEEILKYSPKLKKEGFIFNYFKNENNQKIKNITALTEEQNIYIHYKPITISGTIFDDKNFNKIEGKKSGLANIEVYLYLEGIKPVLKKTKTDENGNFIFKVSNLPLGTKFEIKSKGNFLKTPIKISLDATKINTHIKIPALIKENRPKDNIIRPFDGKLKTNQVGKTIILEIKEENLFEDYSFYSKKNKVALNGTKLEITALSEGEEFIIVHSTKSSAAIPCNLQLIKVRNEKLDDTRNDQTKVLGNSKLAKKKKIRLRNEHIL